MVLAGKVFLVRENYEMDTLAEKLKSFRIETETSVEEKEFKLVSEITDLSVGKGTLEGKFSFDSVFVVPHRGEAVPVPRTYEAPFSFNTYNDRIFLSVYDKKNRANSVANDGWLPSSAGNWKVGAALPTGNPLGATSACLGSAVGLVKPRCFSTTSRRSSRRPFWRNKFKTTQLCPAIKAITAKLPTRIR